MMPTTVLQMVGDVSVVVPDSLDLITPYVLVEQQDWFEDEIRFLRVMLQPGDQLIDIGANHGLYTLAMAKSIGGTGHIWAFEPASSTASLLLQSIEINQFHNITLEKCALSNTSGTAQLSLHAHSELNTLAHNSPASNTYETVQLATLDECMLRFRWSIIDFVKIDAEGEEANIIKGAFRFFSTLSPLVMYEIKAGETINTELINSFKALGYDSYKLVPGLAVLVPFDETADIDDYQLNLFCCKQDRAEILAHRGYLLTEACIAEQLAKGSPFVDTDENSIYHWRHSLGSQPYSKLLRDTWQTTRAQAPNTRLERALASYAFSRDAAQPIAARYQALTDSYRLLSALCLREPVYLRLLSLARIARALGERLQAVRALSDLNDRLYQTRKIECSEPFLPANERFDDISPDASMDAWVMASLLEELEKSWAFSSFYTGPTTRQRLETIRTLGFASDEMSRRLMLIEQRFG